MSLLDPIRNYCERTSDTLLSEPLNAVSNAAFFIAAWALWRTYCALPQEQRTRPVAILIAMITLVGIGSMLFHTFANGLTMIFDVVPISLLTLYYLWLALRQLLGYSRLHTAMKLLVFVLVAMQMPHLPAQFRFNGSVDYFPCLAALLLIGGALHKRHHPAAPWLLRGALCFIVSLTFRSIDFLICPTFPLGTHFLWHSLNGLMLYLLVRGIMVKRG